jgi:hypothetical protein
MRKKIDKEKLEELVGEGFNDKEIAAMWNMHRGSIRRARRRYGIPPVDTKTRLRRIYRVVEDLNSKGCKDREIGEVIGIPSWTVYSIRKKLGIPKADFRERMDKTYICKSCGYIVLIKRKERRRKYCPECRESKKSKASK